MKKYDTYFGLALVAYTYWVIMRNELGKSCWRILTIRTEKNHSKENIRLISLTIQMIIRQC